MANIQLTPLYEQKQREFNVQGAGLSRFEQDFIVATNRAINEMNRSADLSTRITRITETEDEVALDEKYEDVISIGISYHLHLMGQRASKGSESLIPIFKGDFLAGIQGMYYDLKNLAYTADNTTITIGIDGME